MGWLDEIEQGCFFIDIKMFEYLFILYCSLDIELEIHFG